MMRVGRILCVLFRCFRVLDCMIFHPAGTWDCPDIDSVPAYGRLFVIFVEDSSANQFAFIHSHGDVYGSFFDIIENSMPVIAKNRIVDNYVNRVWNAPNFAKESIFLKSNKVSSCNYLLNFFNKKLIFSLVYISKTSQSLVIGRR